MTRPGRSELEALADRWVGEYRDAHHLRHALDWLLVIAPDADEAMRIATLTHDMERHFPGGPIVDPARNEPDDLAYNAAHQGRSASIVRDWLLEQGADAALAGDVAHLIERHELGGDERQDVVQAADSLSFLETKRDLMLGWLADGKCDVDRALRQPRWMFDRIRFEPARPLAEPLLEETLAAIEEAAG